MFVKITCFRRGVIMELKFIQKKMCFLLFISETMSYQLTQSFVFFVFSHTKFVLFFPTLRYLLYYYDFWIGPLQFLADLQQSLNSANANGALADLFSRYLANVWMGKAKSVCAYVCVHRRGHTEVWWWLATPAINHAPASAELKCVSRSHAGSTTLSPPKQNTEVIYNKRISCLLSFPFQKVLLHRKSVVSPFMDILQCGLPWKWVLALLFRGTPPLINWGGLREKNVIKDSHFIMTAIFRGGWGSHRFKG